MANTIIGLVFYISTLAISFVTLSLIIRNWKQYGLDGQIQTRLYMVVSNTAMCAYIITRVVNLVVITLAEKNELNILHSIESILIFIAFMAWLRLFLP